MSMGAGLTSGPLLTFLLKEIFNLNYVQTFYTLAIMIFVLGNIFCLIIPQSVNKTMLRSVVSEDERDE